MAENNNANTADSGADEVPSPCVKQCCLDDNDICVGCFRSLDEICDWAASDAEARQATLTRTDLRRKLATPN